MINLMVRQLPDVWYSSMSEGIAGFRAMLDQAKKGDASMTR